MNCRGDFLSKEIQTLNKSLSPISKFKSDCAQMKDKNGKTFKKDSYYESLTKTIDGKIITLNQEMDSLRKKSEIVDQLLPKLRTPSKNVDLNGSHFELNRSTSVKAELKSPPRKQQCASEADGHSISSPHESSLKSPCRSCSCVHSSATKLQFNICEMHQIKNK